VTTKPPDDDGLRRVDVDGVTLVWGDRTRAKAMLRAESLRRHLELPIADRLRAALALVQRRTSDE
jgi:hypothetical protein